MTKFNLSKEQIIRAVLKELPEKSQQDTDFDIDRLMIRWWKTGRQQGLQLTEVGDLNFRLAQIEFFEFPIKVEYSKPVAWYVFLSDCNKKLKCPFYISAIKGQGTLPFIRVYDQTIAVMIQLYGSLEDYLPTLKEKRK